MSVCQVERGWPDIHGLAKKKGGLVAAIFDVLEVPELGICHWDLN
jgi:hypothetical protein